MSSAAIPRQHHVARNVGLAIGMLAFVGGDDDVADQRLSLEDQRQARRGRRPAGRADAAGTTVEQIRIPVTESAVGTCSAGTRGGRGVEDSREGDGRQRQGG